MVARSSNGRADTTRARTTASTSASAARNNDASALSLTLCFSAAAPLWRRARATAHNGHSAAALFCPRFPAPLKSGGGRREAAVKKRGGQLGSRCPNNRSTSARRRCAIHPERAEGRALSFCQKLYPFPTPLSFFFLFFACLLNRPRKGIAKMTLSREAGPEDAS